MLAGVGLTEDADAERRTEAVGGKCEATVALSRALGLATALLVPLAPPPPAALASALEKGFPDESRGL